MGKGEGLQNGRGEQVKFYAYKKGGLDEKGFSHAIKGGGGHTQFLGRRDI